MTTLVVTWTGREAAALRKAKRMTLEEFAGRLGISVRMVSKWEAAGARVIPREVNQAALDSVLSASTAEEVGRFRLLIEASTPQGTVAEVDLETTVDTSAHLRHPRDGKMMVLVPEGIYLGGEAAEPHWVDASLIDAHPVTNADYARFTTATGHPAPRHWENGRCPKSLFDHPVVWVTHHDATAYAAWAGKALPTAAQWEKAARGTAGAVYPWGDQKTVAKCNVRESGIGHTTPVSRYHSGVSPFGAYDMCGNTWEWCATETETGRFELKGSAFTSPFFRCAPSSYNDADAQMYDDDTGFRCVASVEGLLPDQFA